MMTKDEAKKAFEQMLEGLEADNLDALMVVADTDTMSACLVNGGAQTLAELCLASIKYQIENAPEEAKKQLASIYRMGIMDITRDNTSRLSDLIEGTMRELNKEMMS